MSLQRRRGVVAGARTVAASGPVTGDIAATLPALVQAVAGSVEVRADIAASLPALEQAATGTVLVGGAVTADIAATLPALEQAATGSVPIIGDLAATLPALEQAVSGTVATSTTYADEVNADSPVAYFRLGEASGTTAADSAGTSDGTYVNTPTLGVAGIVAADDAITVTRANSERVELPAAVGDVFEGTSWTLEMWIKTTFNPGTSNDMVLFSAGSSTDNSQFAMLRFGRNSSDNGFGVGYLARVADGTNNDIVHEDTTLWRDGNWHQFVVVRDGSTLRLYRDKVERDSDTVSASPALDQGSIGSLLRSSSVLHFEGTVDEVSVYNTALSLARIAAHYDAV